MSPTPSQTQPAAPSTPRLFWLVLAVAGGLLALYLVKTGVLRGPGSVAAKAASARVEAPDLRVKRSVGPLQEPLPLVPQGQGGGPPFLGDLVPPLQGRVSRSSPSSRPPRRPADPWVVVPVSIDDTAEPVGPFLSKLSERFPVYWDAAGRWPMPWQMSAVPTTVVLDKDGKVAWQARGWPTGPLGACRPS